MEAILIFSLDSTYKFEDLIKEMDDRIGWMPIEKFKFDPVTSKDYFVNANWALYCDNYLEGFHIPFVHGGLNKTLDYDKYHTEVGFLLFFDGVMQRENSIFFDLPKNQLIMEKKLQLTIFGYFLI